MLENAPTAAAKAVADRGRLDVAALVREYHAELYRYAYRLTGSVQDAEDLTQQVFLIAQARGDQLRDPSHAGSWLFTILRNTFLKTTRRKTPLPAGSLAIDLEGVPDKVTADDIDRELLQ